MDRVCLSNIKEDFNMARHGSLEGGQEILWSFATLRKIYSALKLGDNPGRRKGDIVRLNCCLTFKHWGWLVYCYLKINQTSHLLRVQIHSCEDLLLLNTNSPLLPQNREHRAFPRICHLGLSSAELQLQTKKGVLWKAPHRVIWSYIPNGAGHGGSYTPGM